MKKSFTSLLIALLILGPLIGLWPLKAHAYTWSGEGIPGDPYLITTAEDLYQVRYNLSASYKLQADIDLSDDYPNWEPIGTASNWFQGHFDGADYTISNMKINSNAANIGLFGVMRQPGTIKNVRLENVDITLSDNNTANVGGLVGIISSSTPYTALGRISVTGEIRANNAYSAGGLVGNLSIAGLSNSDAHVRIDSGYTYAGGAVGINSSGTIEQSYATGDVYSGRNTGGLVGWSQNSGFLNSYATGDVTGADNVTHNKIGGLTGDIPSGKSIVNSYAAGFVRKGSGSQTGSQIGGLVGGLSSSGSATITNSYWNNDGDNALLQTKGWESGTGGAMSREALKQIDIAGAGWDPAIWSIQTGESYPYLKSFSPVLRVNPFPPASIYATEPGYNELTISGFVRDGSIGEPWEVSYTIKDDEDNTVTQGDQSGIATAHNQAFSLTTTLDESSYPLGTYTISITVKDTVVRTEQPQTLTFEVVDRTAPSAPTLMTPGNGQLTNDSMPTVSGIAEAGATVTIMLDGSAAGTAVAEIDGSWTWTASTDLADGTHTVKARATDGAGNVSPDSAVHTFTVDRTAPAAPTLTTPVNGQQTNDSTPTVSGIAEAGATVTIVLDGNAAGTAVAGAGGSWTWTVATDLTDGTHTVKVRATDGAGNVSPDSAVHTFTVDRTAPSAPTLTTPGNGQLTNDATPTVSGIAEAGATVTIVLDGNAAGTAVAEGDGSWTWTASTDLADGTHTVKVRATDGAGNVSPDSAVHTFTVDGTAPTAPVLATPGDGQQTKDATPTVSGTAEAGTTVTIVLDGNVAGTAVAEGDGSWTWTVGTELMEGTHTVKVRAADTAGNVSPDSAVYTFTVDRTAPATPTLATPGNGQQTNDATPTVSGTAEAGATVTIVLDGNAVGTVVAEVYGSWTWTASTELTEGAHAVKVRAADGAGNVSPDSAVHTFTVDRTAPAAPVLTTPSDGQLTNNATPTVSGTAEVGATVTIVLDGNAAGTVVAGIDGSWKWTSGTELTEGTHTVKVRVTDGAGNVSSDSAVHTFTVDRTVPAAPIITAPVNGQLTDDAMPMISGTAEAGMTVTIVLDGHVVGTVVAGVYGSWTWTAGMELTDGMHTVKARAANGAGSVSADSAVHTFTVNRTAPLITLRGSARVQVEAGSSYTDPGATAEDRIEGDITSRITVTGSVYAHQLGTYILEYRVSNQQGISASTVIRSVYVVDTQAPVITLLGDDYMILAEGDGFVDPGATAADSFEGDVRVAVTGGVDTQNPGTYHLRYNAQDSSGNAAMEVTRTVRVEAMAPSSPNSSGGVYGSGNADLKQIRVLAGGNELTLTPAFAAGITSYKAETTADRVDIQVISSDANAVITLREAVHNGAEAFALTLGDNPFEITIKAENGTIKIYSLTIHRQIETGTQPVPSESSSCVFTDIHGHWAELQICEAADKGIVEGVSATLFHPQGLVTRVEFAAMLLRAFGSSTGREAVKLSFTDTDAIPVWAHHTVRDAVETGLLEGYPDGTLRPNQTVSRSEMAAMVARVMKWDVVHTQKTAFADDEDIPEWARGYIHAAFQRGVLEGREGKQYMPYGETTRAEAAVVVLRMLKI